LRKGEISLKDISNVRDAVYNIARGIKNMRAKLVEKHIQSNINKLRVRKYIVPKLIHKRDIIQGEEVIYLDDAGTKHFTFLIIPKSHILLVLQGSEAGEPFLIFGHVS
jgi:hypothetical protein